MLSDTARKYAPTIGSIVVDGALIAAVAWWGSGVQATQAAMTDTQVAIVRRIEKLEVTDGTTTPETRQRLAVAEAKIVILERDRQEMLAILRRLEDRFDTQAGR